METVGILHSLIAKFGPIWIWNVRLQFVSYIFSESCVLACERGQFIGKRENEKKKKKIRLETRKHYANIKEQKARCKLSKLDK